ncbi:MAG TPA: hypothetical protein VGK26_04065 [Thermoanaerobaculia bacterium]
MNRWRWTSWVPEILLVVITTAAGLWAGGRWLNPVGDPGNWWSLLERMGQGEALYRDIFLQYGPLTPLLMNLASRAFGLSSTSFLLFNWIPAILLGVLLLRASRPFFTTVERLVVLALILALGVFGGGVAQSRLIFCYCPAAVVGLVFAVGSLLFLLRDEPRRFDPFAAGILAGLAFCAKQEIGLAAIAGLCMPLLTRGRRHGVTWAVQSVGAFLAVGFAIMAGTTGGVSLDSLRHDSHLWPIGTVPPEWRDLYRLAAGVTGLGWQGHVVRSAVGLGYCLLVGILTAWILTRDARSKRIVPLLVLGALLAIGVYAQLRFGWRRWDPLCLSMIVSFVLALAAIVDKSLPRREFIAGFGLFAGIVAARTAFTGRGWNVYSSVANVCGALVWPLLLLCVLPPILLGRTAAARVLRRIWLAGLLPVAVYFAWSAVSGLRDAAAIAMPTRQGSIWVYPWTAPFISLIGENVRPGERALILPESNGVDALFGLRSASPLLSYLPGWLDERAEHRLLGTFADEPPDVVILFERSSWEYGVAPFGEGYGRRLGEWISQNYSVTAGKNGGAILRRKKAA